jgi:hypothetical protein
MKKPAPRTRLVREGTGSDIVGLQAGRTGGKGNTLSCPIGGIVNQRGRISAQVAAQGINNTLGLNRQSKRATKDHYADFFHVTSTAGFWDFVWSPVDR